MKKVVSFSGGRTSAYLCHLIIERYGVENVEIVFMDTGFEHPSTYNFIRDCNKWLKSQITFLRGDFSMPLGGGVHYNVVGDRAIGCDGEPFADMMAKYGAPYIGGMFCTDRMKLKPFKKYCDDKYGKGNYETWLGIRHDEPKRLWGDNRKSTKSAYRQLLACGFDDYEMAALFADLRDGSRSLDEVGNLSCLAMELIDIRLKSLSKDGLNYLSQISEFEKQDVLNFWSKTPFDLEIPEHLGNCVFCPKKSNLKLAAAQRDEPELYIKWLEMLYSDSVRVDDKTGRWSKMYRGKQSLENLIATFDGSTGDEIKARMRGAKHLDTGSCSESCEVFCD